MRKILIIGAAIAAVTAASAEAQVTFNVDGTFTGGGKLTGTFTTNDALSAITNYSIVAAPGSGFTGFTYNPADSSVTASVLPSQYFQIDSIGNVDELRIYFASALTKSGTTINGTFSYEHEPSGGNRSFTGTVTQAAASGVPEPASWMMMILGVGAVGYATRRRQKMVSRAYSA